MVAPEEKIGNYCLEAPHAELLSIKAGGVATISLYRIK
jgi:hypothetical protein